MLVTYVFQASLVTVCVFALAASRLDWADRVPIFTRTLLAVRHSIGSFLSASFVFCIAMLFASLLATVDDASNARLTTWALMLIVPVSSILPVLILHIATANTLRRAQGWKMLWAVVVVLLFALMMRTLHAVRTDGAAPGRWNIEQSQWESNCLISPGLTLGPIINLALVVGGLLFFGIGAHLVHFVVSKWRRAKEKKATRLVQIIRWITLVSAFSFMWTFVGWLIYFTLLLRDRTRNGNKDQEWGFGQVLALATWIPCVVEFAYVWWENPKEALNGRLMKPYSVVEAPEKLQSLEMGGGRVDVEDDQQQRLI
jgi:heme/copper-type cytochrome/quinol oxidase subunit 2